MMGFKELLRQDVGIFLNADEFADVHTVNGKPMRIMVDDNEMIEREKRIPAGQTEGIYRRKLMFYVASKEFGPLPAIGLSIKVDGRQYRVIDSINESGIYSISLEAVRGL